MVTKKYFGIIEIKFGKMMNSRANVRPYNAQVLLGNWYEDRVMEEEVLKDFLDKRYTGQLASQKMTEVERMSQSV